MSRRRSPGEIRALLDGPVNSIPTTFMPDGALDVPGIRQLIETGIAGGSQVNLLTFGDSQFDYLSDAEVGEITRLLVDQCRGRVLTVAANRNWWTGQSVEFARYCVEIGVDVLMIMPGWVMRSQADGLVDYYRAVAGVMPVMLNCYGAMPWLDQLADTPNVCSVKEDWTEEAAVALLQRHGGHWKIMTGGGYGRHLRQWPHGARAFMSWLSCLKPELANQYWRAVQAGDPSRARRMVDMIETPLFVLSERFPGGWQGLWRAALEIHGTARRYLRPPARSASDADLEVLRTHLAKLGL